ncbi:MAG: DedA family protein [Archangiaceae bacterium]|nr:DedA family protein [Archangiaceae bacterium]
MESFLFNLVGGTSGGLAYLVVFGILFVCGLGLPLPEDVSLILGGYLVHDGKAQLELMMLTGYLGIIVGDSMIFTFGRRFGSKVGSKPTGFFARIVTPEKRARVEQLFKKHGEKIIMLARFLPGVRAVTYFTAGSVGMKWRRFVLYDSIAALGSAPIFVYLGFKFGGELDTLISAIKRGQRNVLIAMVLIGVVAFLISRWRAKREQKLNEDALREKQLSGEHPIATVPATPPPEAVK